LKLVQSAGCRTFDLDAGTALPDDRGVMTFIVRRSLRDAALEDGGTAA